MKCCFYWLEMVKKRIVKKRIQKRKQVKKEVKGEKKGVPDISHMSKLEYEQSMMDPRFRAAMMGFNNPVGNNQLQQVNQALHEKETKNNEMTMLMEAQQKLANVKKEKLKLKEQAKQEKLLNQEKIHELEEKVAEKDREFKEAQQRHKQEQETANLEHGLKIALLTDAHRRAIEPIQEKINRLATSSDIQKLKTEQAEAIAEATANLTKAKMKKTFQNKIQPIQEKINQLATSSDIEKLKTEQAEAIANATANLTKAEMKKALQAQLKPIEEKMKDIVRKTDIEQLQFKGAEQIADATFKKTQAEMKKELQAQILPITQATNEMKRQNELAQQEHNNTIQTMNASYENIMEAMKAQQEALINPLTEHTQELKAIGELEQKQHEERMKLKDSVKDLMIAEFKAQIEPSITAFNEKNEELKRGLDELKQKAETVKQLKDTIHQYNTLKTQIDYQPVLQQMNLQFQEMKNQLDENKQVFEEIKKQNELKTRIAQTEQIVDPVKRDEYNEKVKQEKMETHKLELIHSYAKNAERAYLEKEAVRSKIIETAAKIFPDFSVEEIDSKDFRKRLLDEEVNLRKKHAQQVQQLEMANRLLDEQRSIDKLKIENEAAIARIEASKDKASAEYMNKIQTSAQVKLRLSQETKHLNEISESLVEDIAERNQAADEVQSRIQTLLEQRPLVKSEAEKMANRRRGDNKGLITYDIFKQAEEAVNEKARQDLRALENIPMNIENHEQISQAIETIKQYGYNINQRRDELTKEKEDLEEQIRQYRVSVSQRDTNYEALQLKYNQAQQLIRATNNALIKSECSIPELLNNHEMNSEELQQTFENNIAEANTNVEEEDNGI